MSDSENMVFGYSILSESFYFNSLKNFKDHKEEIHIGYYCLEGGTTGEFSLGWSEIDGNLKMKATVFSDGYNAFSEFLVVFNDFTDTPNPTPEIVLMALKKHGAKDFTKRN